MSKKKIALLTVRTTPEWLEIVKAAANAADTDVSQFVRDAVNARIRQQQSQQPITLAQANQL
jgi:uncharacterized protein (DUF1778 family)